MKKILLVSFLAFLGFSGFSQGKIKNTSFVNICYNRPIMNYGEVSGYNTNDNLFKYYQNRYDDLQHLGGGLEFGSTFYIHPTSFVDGFKAGIIVDFIDLGANYFSFTDSTVRWGSNYPADYEFGKPKTYMDINVRYSLNIGLSLTFSPTDDFFIDIYGKARPTLLVNYFSMPLSYDKLANAPDDKMWVEDSSFPEVKANRPLMDQTGTGFGMKSSFGFNIRYAKVSLGAEWVLGKVNVKYNGEFKNQLIEDQFLKVKLGLFFVD